MAASDHSGQGGPAQPNGRGDMDLDHAQMVAGFPLPKGTRPAAEAGVIDEKAEGVVPGDTALDAVDAFGNRQVGLEGFDRYGVLFPELAGQIFEPV